MALVIFGFTYALAAAIFAVIAALAQRGLAKSLKAISVGMLPSSASSSACSSPSSRRRSGATTIARAAAVSREASALRAAVLVLAARSSRRAGGAAARPGARLCRADRHGGVADDGPSGGVARDDTAALSEARGVRLALPPRRSRPAECAARARHRARAGTGCAAATDHREPCGSGSSQMGGACISRRMACCW